MDGGDSSLFHQFNFSVSENNLCGTSTSVSDPGRSTGYHGWDVYTRLDVCYLFFSNTVRWLSDRRKLDIKPREGKALKFMIAMVITCKIYYIILYMNLVLMWSSLVSL